MRIPNLETRTQDLRCVLDAAGSHSAVMAAQFESLAPRVLLAASDPDRVSALVWRDPFPRPLWAPEYPWGFDEHDRTRLRESLEHWGTIRFGQLWADQMEESARGRPQEWEIGWASKASRNTCTPDVAIALTEAWWDTDLRGVLPAVKTPTLLVVDEDKDSRALADYVAALMPNAQVEAFPVAGFPTTWEEIQRANGPRLEAIQRFIGLEPGRAALHTILSTVLFTDIVASTGHQARLGDHAWKQLVEQHNACVRDALHTWRGVENDTAGDGFYATFDGPARAIHCAHQIRDQVRRLGIEIRAGVHTGECELVDGKCAGLSVSVGARIAALAEPSQVLVSQTVKDLVAGSGFKFTPADQHILKGVPGHWNLYRAA